MTFQTAWNYIFHPLHLFIFNFINSLRYLVQFLISPYFCGFHFFPFFLQFLVVTLRCCVYVKFSIAMCIQFRVKFGVLICDFSLYICFNCPYIFGRIVGCVVWWFTVVKAVDGSVYLEFSNCRLVWLFHMHATCLIVCIFHGFVNAGCSVLQPPFNDFVSFFLIVDIGFQS